MRQFLCLALLALVAVVSCPLGSYADDNGGAAGGVEKIAAGNNQFALDLYQRLAAKPGNIFFSPYSVENAAGMLYSGAGGQTAKELQQTFHFPTTPDVLARDFAAMNAAMEPAPVQKMGDEGEKPPQPFTLTVADALFGQKGYAFKQSYLDVLKDQYHAPLQEVNFVQSEQAAKTINDWVADKTHDKIKDLVQPDSFNDLTRLVLVNAIYFKANWLHQFEESATQKAPFHLLDGKSVDVPLMTQQRNMLYSEGDGYQAVLLPYADMQTAMVLIVPTKADGLAGVEKMLTNQKDLNTLKFGAKLVDLYLPKFMMTQSIELSDKLSAMGMPSAFNSKTADFSGITDSQDPRQKPSVSAVIQKTFIDVNEHGTEAAAATAMTMAGSAMPHEPPPQPVIVRADHPFVFFIEHIPTGATLFMGRIENPNK